MSRATPVAAATVALFFVACPPRLSAKVIYVKADASGPTQDGTSWATAYTDLTTAVGSAAEGDELWFAGGTYPGHAVTSVGISLYGGFAGDETSRDQRDPQANPTTLIRAGYYAPAAYWDSTVHIAMGTTSRCVLDGLAITGGRGSVVVSQMYAPPAGGGIYCTGGALLISNCTLSGNTASVGGAIYTDKCDLTLQLSSIVSNSISFYDFRSGFGGSGIVSYEGEILIEGNEIVGNTAGEGYVFGTPEGAPGGGVYAGASSGTITRNDFRNNTAGYGSAVYVDSSTLTVADNLVAGNAGTDSDFPGTAIVASNGSTVANNLVILNQAPGIQCDGKVVNNTVVANSIPSGAVAGQGTGIVSAGTVANNIVELNDAGISLSGSPVVSNNNVFANASAAYSGMPDPTGTNGNIAANSHFVDAANGNYRLTAGSPCIDAGNDTFALTPTDLDGHLRILGAHVDIGAYEFVPPGHFTFADVTQALRLAGGLKAATAAEVGRLDDAFPPPPDGRIDIVDAVRIARRVTGFAPNP